MRSDDASHERFVREERIGQGGMGVVHRALDRTTGARVALKLVLEKDEGLLARFEQECVALARVSHPGVVRYVAHGRMPDGVPYLATEWQDGVDLSRRLHGSRELATLASRDAHASAVRAGLLSVSDTLALARRLADGLGALHALGIVHRDVKPSNVYLPGGDPARALLLDLGVARWQAAGLELTRTGMVVGTPWYMAPEQARADRAVGPEADVFALGCVITECLVGSSPFRAEHFAAALAKILLDDPPLLTETRPDVARALALLVRRLLSKEPEARPRTGAEVHEALCRIEASCRIEAPDDRSAPLAVTLAAASTRGAISGSERRVRTLLLARHARGAGTEPPPGVMVPDETLERFGAELVPLYGGIRLVTVSGTRAPTDEATRLARAALALSSPRTSIAIATGQAELGRAATSELAERAARLLESAGGGQVVLDELTAALIEGRFDVAREAGGASLVAERVSEAPRTLLGRPTRTVGRRRELALLESTLAECAEDGVARAVLVTGAAGMGKSRLRHELASRLGARKEPWSVIAAQGDALAAGSSFALLGPALRRALGVREADPIELRRESMRARAARELGGDRRAAALLAEIAGLGAGDDEALRAVRADPAVYAEALRDAFVRWLGARTREAPVLLVLDDLHWGDLPSVRLVDAALRLLADRPLFVLALARPEVHAQFPALFAERALVEVRLDALTPKSAAELVRQVLGDELPPPEVEAIVARAEGNAFFLEELIRAAHEQAGALPESVLGMVQARLDALPSEARMVLRAASVVGEALWQGALERLLGTGALSFSVGEWLGELASKELLGEAREARYPGQRELRFRHALVRDAAYATLPDEERAALHLGVAEWLEDVGERDALLLARHARLGGDRASAARWLREAAEHALDTDDVLSARAHAEDGLALGAPPELAGELHRIACVAAYWASDYRASTEHGERGLALLPAGSHAWLLVAGATLVSWARLGETARFEALFERVVGADAAPGALGEQLIALARGTFQLIFATRLDAADRVLARIDELMGQGDALPARCLAQVHHVRGLRAAMVGDVGTFLVHLMRAVDAFEQARDERNASLERTTVGWCWAEVGMAERAVSALRESLARCERARAQQAITYAKVNLGYALSLRAEDRQEAERTLLEAIAECAAVKNARLEGWARAHLSTLALARGEHARAEEEARLARERLAASPGLSAWAGGAHARALVALGRAAEARAIAEASMATVARLGGLLQGESLPPLALAEALHALGDEAAYRRAADDAKARLARRAERLPEAEWRETFLSRADSRATLALP